MIKGKIKLSAVIIIMGMFSKMMAPALYANEPDQVSELAVQQQVQSILPLSIQMVDRAIALLSGGWQEMSPAEQEAFLTLYDPAHTGEIDEQFVGQVLANYYKIRRALKKELDIDYAGQDGRCVGQRLYYTNIMRIYVCPYFLTETNDARKARTLIHEYTHIALLVTDRPYYRPTSKAYTKLTPRGTWTSQIPLLGPILREMAGEDTLYHPDAYAHFALAVSSLANTISYQD